MGWEGYGLFWALVERLSSETNYKMEIEYDCIAFALRTDKDRIKSLIEDYDLFIVEGKYFYSERLNKCMALRDDKSEKARQSVRKRWDKANKDNTNVLHPNNERNTIKGNKSILNKSKVDKNKNLYSAKFEQFWHEYPSKIGKKKAFTSFKLVKIDIEVLLNAVKQQKETSQWRSGYIPHPATWLNQGRWEDDIEALNVKRNSKGTSDDDHDKDKREQRRLAENKALKQKYPQIFEA